MAQLLSTLILGFFLGIKHAFEADHMIAVSQIVNKHNNPLKAALVGTFWGMGHTTSLFIIGLIVLLAKISIPINISLLFELLVGVLLVFLGIKSLTKIKSIIHSHIHKHYDQTHSHAHQHSSQEHKHSHKSSFIIGSLHGLAGSGALMILVLSTIRSTLSGVFYILIFGLGSILGMTAISVLLGVPFIYSTKKFPKVSLYINLIAGVISIVFGLFIIYEIGFVGGLLL